MTIMNKTYAPELAPELHRSANSVYRIQDLFRYASHFACSGVYLRGLARRWELKSIEPMASRVPRPPELLGVKDPEQALQQFVNQSPWDEQKGLRRTPPLGALCGATARRLFLARVLDDADNPP